VKNREFYPKTELPDRITGITILRPGGNDTALIPNLYPPDARRIINDSLMKQFSNVEQVGFYSLSPGNPEVDAQLVMAGGEFCGNATRCATYLALKGRKGEIKIQVSGAKQILEVGIDEKSNVYAQMPVIKDFSCIQKTRQITIVSLEGIAHVIVEKPPFNEEQLRKEANTILGNLSLKTSKPAAGVLFITQEDDLLRIDPFVWVRDIETFFYETACASGTAALGLKLAFDKKEPINSIPILQPSGLTIAVSVDLDEKGFKKTFISGPVEVIEESITLML